MSAQKCAAVGMTEEAVEKMAGRYREPAPAQAAPDLASDDWPDLNGSAAKGSSVSQDNAGALSALTMLILSPRSEAHLA